MAYFLAAIALIGAVGVSLAAPFLLVGRVWRRPRRVGARMFQSGVHLLLRCQPWLRADVAISPRAEGALYVSNHRSNLDVFILLGHIAGIRVLAKRSLRLVPFLGEAMWLTRQIFVRRGRGEDLSRAMREIERGLREGDALHVFPEYTRCAPGFTGTQKFALAPFQVAIAANAAVVPIVFRGTDAVWPKGALGLRPREPVSVVSLPPLAAADYSSPRALMLEVKARIDAAIATPSASGVPA
jgi:1-acyl-sn-glycerol-3-phosphate acyltransferase